MSRQGGSASRRTSGSIPLLPLRSQADTRVRVGLLRSSQTAKVVATFFWLKKTKLFTSR